MSDPDIVDLRSDTVTRPTAAMRHAMASADVGDDVYGEDPTVRRLEERVAELLGKETSLFVPSGTMANQIAILLHTRRGDDVIVGEGAHLATFESGAGAALGGVQFTVAAPGGLFAAEDVERAMKPRQVMYPRSALVAVENTHNRAGGRVFPAGEIDRIARVARQHSLGLHLDGARLWNAAVATRRSESELARAFDTVSVCFSKGLGAPVGSALALPKALADDARRYRKMLGGGMRQAGVLAAAAVYALEHHRERLGEDHLSARELAAILARVRGASVDISAVETNIVNVELAEPAAERIAAETKRAGVLVHATGPSKLRLVTHLDAPISRVRKAGEILSRAIESVARRVSEKP